MTCGENKVDTGGLSYHVLGVGCLGFVAAKLTPTTPAGYDHHGGPRTRTTKWHISRKLTDLNMPNE